MNITPPSKDPFLEFSRFVGAIVIMGHHTCFYTEGGIEQIFLADGFLWSPSIWLLAILLPLQQDGEG